MSGVIKLFWLPLVALSLLLLGCGVEIAPDAITATAIADETVTSGQSLRSTSASDDNAQSLREGSSELTGAPASTIEPLATLAVPTTTATPEPGDIPGPDNTETATSESDADSDDVTPTPDADADPEATETASETPTPEATATRTPTPEPTATPLPVVTNANSTFAGEFLSLLNAQRTGRGLGPLSLNVILTNDATEYAGYMGTAGFFSHDGPDGSTPGSRAGASGYSGAWNGEALSAGQPSPQTALNALLASPSHAAILLNPTSVEVGVGYAFVEGSRYLHYWVIVTGIP